MSLRELASGRRRRQTFESVCSSVSAEQRQSHRVQTLLQTVHAVDLHCVVVGLKEPQTQNSDVIYTHQREKVLLCFKCSQNLF